MKLGENEEGPYQADPNAPIAGTEVLEALGHDSSLALSLFFKIN